MVQLHEVEAHPGDQALLGAHLHASPLLLCETIRAPGPSGGGGGGGGGTARSLRLAKGLLYAEPVDALLMKLVAELDGSRSTLDARFDLARASGEPLDELVRQILPRMRDLIERGFVVPAAWTT